MSDLFEFMNYALKDEINSEIVSYLIRFCISEHAAT